MNFTTFAKRWLGKRTDPDKVFNFQCVDLIIQGLRDMHGIISGVWGNAIDYWNRPTPTLLKKFSKVPGSAVKQGDIVVLRGMSGNRYGHIGWATGKTTTSNVEILEQNGSSGSGSGTGGNAVRTRYVPRSRVAGLLRVRSASTPPAQRYTVVSGDTISGIAARHKKTTKQIIDWNKTKYVSLVKDPDHIQIGWVFRVG